MRERTLKSINGVTKADIDNILTNRPHIVTDVTVISQVNIRSGHEMVVSNIELDVEVERKTLMKERQTCHILGMEIRIFDLTFYKSLYQSVSLIRSYS